MQILTPITKSNMNLLNWIWKAWYTQICFTTVTYYACFDVASFDRQVSYTDTRWTILFTWLSKQMDQISNTCDPPGEHGPIQTAWVSSNHIPVWTTAGFKRLPWATTSQKLCVRNSSSSKPTPNCVHCRSVCQNILRVYFEIVSISRWMYWVILTMLTFGQNEFVGFYR